MKTKVINCNSANKSCLVHVVHTKAIAALTQFCDFLKLKLIHENFSGKTMQDSNEPPQSWKLVNGSCQQVIVSYHTHLMLAFLRHSQLFLLPSASEGSFCSMIQLKYDQQPDMFIWVSGLEILKCQKCQNSIDKRNFKSNLKHVFIKSYFTTMIYYTKSKIGKNVSPQDDFGWVWS